MAWTGGSWLQARRDPSRRPFLAVAGGLLTAAGLVMGATLLWDASPYWIAYPATGLGVRPEFKHAFDNHRPLSTVRLVFMDRADQAKRFRLCACSCGARRQDQAVEHPESNL